MIIKIGPNTAATTTSPGTLEVQVSHRYIRLCGFRNTVGNVAVELLQEEAAELYDAILSHTEDAKKASQDMPAKTPGQKAYEEDCKRRPDYPFGLYQKRPDWDGLPEYAKLSWERNPTPREYKPMDIREPGTSK